ncbi:hypothetical protein KHQ88_01265 [Mycoplasmatota bacterium]|nr:hypothetical protein KHQ88_01265 [Mycoplasmatota bacterium]
MKRKEKFKSISKLYIIVPMLVIIAIFAIINTLTVRNRIDENYKILEQESLSLAKSFSFTLSNSIDSEQIINDLLESKLRIASGLLAHDDSIRSDEHLMEEANRYDIDVIF